MGGRAHGWTRSFPPWATPRDGASSRACAIAKRRLASSRRRSKCHCPPFQSICEAGNRRLAEAPHRWAQPFLKVNRAAGSPCNGSSTNDGSGKAASTGWKSCSQNLSASQRQTQTLKNMPYDAANALHLTRRFKASREQVFAAFASLDALKLWLGPGECGIITGALDFRVGGSYRMEMRTPTGNALLGGTYREIASPERIVFTWQWLDGDDAPETIVTVSSPRSARKPNEPHPHRLCQR